MRYVALGVVVVLLCGGFAVWTESRADDPHFEGNVALLVLAVVLAVRLLLH